MATTGPDRLWKPPKTWRQSYFTGGQFKPFNRFAPFKSLGVKNSDGNFHFSRIPETSNVQIVVCAAGTKEVSKLDFARRAELHPFQLTGVREALQCRVPLASEAACTFFFVRK